MGEEGIMKEETVEEVWDSVWASLPRDV